MVKVPSLLLSHMNDVKTNTAQASFLLQLVLKKNLLCFDNNCVLWMLCTNRPCRIRKQSYQNIFQRPNMTNHLQQISFTTQKIFWLWRRHLVKWKQDPYLQVALCFYFLFLEGKNPPEIIMIASSLVNLDSLISYSPLCLTHLT